MLLFINRLYAIPLKELITNRDSIQEEKQSDEVLPFRLSDFDTILPQVIFIYYYYIIFNR